MIHPAIAQHLDDIVRLCEEHAVVRLEIFGSAVNANFDAVKSDVDLVIDYSDSPGYDQDFGLESQLETLLGRRVQLVSRENLRNPYYRYAIETTAVTIYSAKGTPGPALSERRLPASDIPFSARTAKLLWDIQDGCSLLLEQTARISFSDIAGQSMLSASVQRRITRIGYASTRLRERDSDTASRLPGIEDFIAARESLLQEYDRVDDRKIWNIIQTHAPALHRAALTLLDEYGPPGGKK